MASYSPLPSPGCTPATMPHTLTVPHTLTMPPCPTPLPGATAHGHGHGHGHAHDEPGHACSEACNHGAEKEALTLTR
eukprot:scaffold33671_cov42-Phaeocystis_antarctica.AAC.1